jgi:hypothetical protein
MSTEIVRYAARALDAVEGSFEQITDMAEWLHRMWRMKLVVIAPSEEIWQEYAKSIGYQVSNEYGANHAITKGSQLVEQNFIGPFVLVVGLPLDLELRLSVLGAIHELQAGWEVHGGRVAYVNYNPPAGLAAKAGSEARALRNKLNRAEIARDLREKRF